MRSLPRASTIVTVGERPGGERRVDEHDAIDLRCLAVAPADARAVDEHLDGRADQGVAALPR